MRVLLSNSTIVILTQTMQVKKSINLKFNLSFKVNDNLPLDACINGIHIHIADFHFKLPNSLEYPQIIVLGTKPVKCPLQMTFIKVDDIKEALQQLDKSVEKICGFYPAIHDLFETSNHTKRVLKGNTIYSIKDADPDLFVDEKSKIEDLFTF